jgi:3-phenylpropionate/trans-cinnamate dioxygenase ferredoxin component
MNTTNFVPVAPVADLPAGQKRVVSAGGHQILLCHSGGRIFAVLNRCSHAAEPLDSGRMKACWIACPVHGARFDLETGEAMNAPATEPIKTFAVRVVEAMIEVGV